VLSFFFSASFLQSGEISHGANQLAETDAIFTIPKRQESEEILRKKDVAWQINLFSDVDHGFSVRGDISKPREKFAKEQAFLQAVHWFDEHIKQ
jgi:dienelactone hydrolase